MVSTDVGETAVHCAVILGLASERRGDTIDARARHRHALDVARRSGEPRLLGLALEGLAAVAVRDRDGDAAARLLGAAAAFRQSLGRATGWGFASIAPVDVDDLRARAGEIDRRRTRRRRVLLRCGDPQSVIEPLPQPAGVSHCVRDRPVTLTA